MSTNTTVARAMSTFPTWPPEATQERIARHALQINTFVCGRQWSRDVKHMSMNNTAPMTGKGPNGKINLLIRDCVSKTGFKHAPK